MGEPYFPRKQRLKTHPQISLLQSMMLPFIYLDVPYLASLIEQFEIISRQRLYLVTGIVATIDRCAKFTVFDLPSSDIVGKVSLLFAIFGHSIDRTIRIIVLMKSSSAKIVLSISEFHLHRVSDDNICDIFARKNFFSVQKWRLQKSQKYEQFKIYCFHLVISQFLSIIVIIRTTALSRIVGL
ncbi:hypothetical protein DYI22_09800 [Marinobacter lipolyticus]|nr:hypothetical protein [Marinobacter lipolyticus]